MKLYIMSDTMTAVKALCTGQRKKKMGVSGESELVVMQLVILYNRVCKLSFNVYSVGEVLRNRNGLKEYGQG